jgi:hypothetical protein
VKEHLTHRELVDHALGLALLLLAAAATIEEHVKEVHAASTGASASFLDKNETRSRVRQTTTNQKQIWLNHWSNVTAP